MPQAADAFEVLGVPADAELEDIRAAYRRAALRCHPDVSPAGRDQAVRRFYQITEAYRSCLRAYRFRRRPQGEPNDTRASPQDYALADTEWLAATISYVRSVGAAEGAPDKSWRKVSHPTRDETGAFIYLWPMAVVLAIGVSVAVAGSLRADLDAAAGIALAAGAYVLVYAACLAGIVGGLVLTRQVVILALQIAGYCARRALPGRTRDADLPPPPRWRLGRRRRGG